MPIFVVRCCVILWTTCTVGQRFTDHSHSTRKLGHQLPFFGFKSWRTIAMAIRPDHPPHAIELVSLWYLGHQNCIASLDRSNTMRRPSCGDMPLQVRCACLSRVRRVLCVFGVFCLVCFRGVFFGGVFGLYSNL